MKKLTLAACVSLLATPAAMADTIFGLYAGGGSISYDLSGEIRDLENSGTEIDTEKDLGLSGESGNYFYVAVEHFVPLLPNIKLSRSDISESSTSTLERSIVFDSQTFSFNEQVESKFDLSHTDATLYYELLDNWVTLDLGLTVRMFDGELSVRSSTDYAQEDLDFAAPLLYGKVKVDLPLTGLYVSAEGNAISVGGVEFIDLLAKVGYRFGFGLGVEVGLREIDFTLDDVEDLEADLSLSGTYAAATFHF